MISRIGTTRVLVVGSGIFILTLAICDFEAAHGDGKERPQRARPPSWTQDVLDVFFDDAQQHLAGERPKPASRNAAIVKSSDYPNAGTESGDRFAWSELVDGETLATEVKRVAAGLRDPLSTPEKFKSGGYKQCRADLSWLAVLFGVIAEYDGEVRWKADAPTLRVSLARAGQNCKTATDQTFAEATARKTDLDDVIRGGSLGGGGIGEAYQWSSLADRAMLMLRMERGLQETLLPKVANESVFRKSLDDVRHESEILTTLANIIVREEYEYWDDETFVNHARELQDAASEVQRATAAQSYETARKAVGRASQECSNCHEGYRG